MVSSYQQSPLAPAIAASDPTGIASPHEGGHASFARGDSAGGRWYVRVALTDGPDTAMQSVRVIVDDRDARRILLHTVWRDWRDVPLLATFLATQAQSATRETIARGLATALVASLQYNADACLEQLGASPASLLPRWPGSQERAAQRNVRDVAMHEHVKRSDPPVSGRRMRAQAG